MMSMPGRIAKTRQGWHGISDSRRQTKTEGNSVRSNSSTRSTGPRAEALGQLPIGLPHHDVQDSVRDFHGVMEGTTKTKTEDALKDCQGLLVFWGLAP
mmetsp:Transcript_65153/g.115946  ORF Transcript_65153/g.115946 Transcript_65153/m.115946 type:complete len:98 (-) Transcript_65153:978-1271(-)